MFSDNTARWRCSAFLITSIHQTSSQFSQHFDYSFTVSRSFIIESSAIHSGNIQIIISGCDYKSLIEMLYRFDLFIWQPMYCSSVVRPYIGREYTRMSLACIERAQHDGCDLMSWCLSYIIRNSTGRAAPWLLWQWRDQCLSLSPLCLLFVWYTDNAT